MADIVHGGINIAELHPIRTQSELLRRFWQYRVLGASDADLRERVIQQFLGELGAELGDMEPLIAALESSDANTRQRVKIVFRHLVGALTALAVSSFICYQYPILEVCVILHRRVYIETKIVAMDGCSRTCLNSHTW